MKLVTHYLPSLRSNPSPCELMRVLERLPAAEKAQMLSPSVLKANSPGWWTGRFCVVPCSTTAGWAPFCSCLSLCLQSALVLGRWKWHLSSGDSHHHLARLCALDPSECLPIHFPLRQRVAVSDWLLLTGYWGNIIIGTCQCVLETLSWTWPRLP